MLFWPLEIDSAAFLQQLSVPFVVDLVSVSLLVFVLTLNCRLRDFVDSPLLNLHLRSELPESRFTEFWEEVQQVVVGIWHVRMNVGVLAHAI